MNEENVEKNSTKSMSNTIAPELDIVSNARVKHHKIYMPSYIYTERD